LAGSGLVDLVHKVIDLVYLVRDDLRNLRRSLQASEVTSNRGEHENACELKDNTEGHFANSVSSIISIADGGSRRGHEVEGSDVNVHGIISPVLIRGVPPSVFVRPNVNPAASKSVEDN